MNEPEKLPSFMEPSYDWPFELQKAITLHKGLILRRTDNPHELLLAKCSKCFARRDASRIELHLAGWTTQDGKYFVEDEGHTLESQFTLCPDCSGKDYVWSDLY